ncbi:MAG TPA: 16S rRNA (adenine(1518)-N(6)/adenine(1519)-N(6))-dimethyltransferase RsmA [Dehalococcoidia bacterium]|nr:16S rRNA (adenine(1518)-N(6)/adenine(1519)-N(6))-dimethyltransferase RsmA [Dehalococcoidia bacterium]
MTRVGARTKKSLGQHWLADPRYLARIADAAEIQPEDTVVEIGPGTGHLTKHLASRASRLIAVEKDDELASRLAMAYAGDDGVRVVHADALEVTPREILETTGGAGPYVVVGNLPYNVGTAIIRRFLQGKPRPRAIVATLQAEVAERIAAKPGQMTYLSVETQVFAEGRLLFRVPPRAFRPPPRVHSGVVRLDVRAQPVVTVEDVPSFIKLAQAGFFAPRKRLRNSLAIGLGVEAAEADRLLAEAGIDGEQRPAMLDMDAWVALFRAYRSGA